MSKSVRLSEEFHAPINAHNRDDETMEETLRRLIGGPSPAEFAETLSDETVAGMRAAIDATSENAVGKRERLTERLGDDS